MKYFPLACIVLAFALPLRADVGIQNGDFSDGTTHWHGDLRSPADFASDNPLNASDPLYSKGMIIPLKHSAWSKVEQDFYTGTGTGTLTITFMVSPDLAFSTTPDDYTSVQGKLGWGWKKFDIPTGSWMINICDSTGLKGMHDDIKSVGKPGTPATMQVKINTTPKDKTTLTFAIPPGSGNFIILNVSYQE